MGKLADIATTQGRTYLTPEDVGDAQAQGVADAEIHAELLAAIADRNVEDATLAAFVAVNGTAAEPVRAPTADE